MSVETAIPKIMAILREESDKDQLMILEALLNVGSLDCVAFAGNVILSVRDSISDFESSCLVLSERDFFDREGLPSNILKDFEHGANANHAHILSKQRKPKRFR